MHAADQFLTSTANIQSNSSLSPPSHTHTHRLTLIYKQAHSYPLCKHTSHLGISSFVKNQHGLTLRAYMGKGGLRKDAGKKGPVVSL